MGSKKSVRFNEVVLRQVYRSNSSILGQKHKNQKKAEQKRRKAARRASEGDVPCDSESPFTPRYFFFLFFRWHRHQTSILKKDLLTIFFDRRDFRVLGPCHPLTVGFFFLVILSYLKYLYMIFRIRLNFQSYIWALSFLTLISDLPSTALPIEKDS